MEENLKTVNVKVLIGKCIEILKPVFFKDSKTQALYLVSQITGIDYTELVVYDLSLEIDFKAAGKILESAKRRACGVPLQYITGKAFFMNEEYLVGEGVLIPRKETEILVEEAGKILSLPENSNNSSSIIEFCTGSGCIIISLAKMLDSLGVSYSATATDISDEALLYARKNLESIKPACNIKIIKHDLLNDSFDNINNLSVRCEMLISNPPYIRTGDIKTLDREVCIYEPAIALDGGLDGLLFYRRLVEAAGKMLKPGGYLLFEIGYDQQADLEKLLVESRNFNDIKFIKDYSGNFRVVEAKRGDDDE